jgi:acyl carrier protein
MNETQNFVLALITRNGALPAYCDVPAFNFLDSGHVDSMGVMQLVVAIEERFDIELSDAEIMADDFRTIGGLCATIDRAIARAAAA